jgi:hypothetical protein
MKRTRRNAERRLCASCGARPARYRYHGHVRRDRTHVLCFQCYRAIRDSQRLAHPATFPLNGRPAAAAGSTPVDGAVAVDRTGTND